MTWRIAALCVAVFVCASAYLPARAGDNDCGAPAGCNSLDIPQGERAPDAQYHALLARLSPDNQLGVMHSRQAWLRARAACDADASCIQNADDREAARLTSLQANLRKYGSEPAQLAAVLRFRQTGQCDHCDLAGADLSHIAPARNVIAPEELCSVSARASGNFDDAHLDHADFTTCLTKRDSRLASLSFDGARLRWADLSDSVFSGVSFRGADLSGAKLSGATFFGVDMTNADLRRATLIGTKSAQEAAEESGSSFANANMRNASLGGAQLYADFEGADLQGADLTGARLSGFTVGGRNVSADARAYFPGRLDDNGNPAPPPRFGGKVNLTDADLSGGSFFGQTAMTPGGFSGAILCRTLLPDGNLSDRDCR